MSVIFLANMYVKNIFKYDWCLALTPPDQFHVRRDHTVPFEPLATTCYFIIP